MLQHRIDDINSEEICYPPQISTRLIDWLMRFNVPKLHSSMRGAVACGSRLILTTWDFFNMHLNLSAQAFLHFDPIKNAAIAAARNQTVISCSAAKGYSH